MPSIGYFLKVGKENIMGEGFWDQVDMDELNVTWGTKVLKAKHPFSALANVEILEKGSNVKWNIQNK